LRLLRDGRRLVFPRAGGQRNTGPGIRDKPIGSNENEWELDTEVNRRLAIMLFLSAALHSWLLWAAPVAQPQAPDGKVVLVLGRLNLNVAAPERAVETPHETVRARPQVETKPPAKKFKPDTEVETAVKPANPAAPEPPLTAPAQKTAKAESAQTASAPQIGANEEPVLVESPAFASPPSPPLYPTLARQRRQQGTVVVEVQLGKAGEQLQRRLLQSSGILSLDRAALAAVESWEFLPYRQNGSARLSRVQLPIRFTL
jgi:protein TonB